MLAFLRIGLHTLQRYSRRTIPELVCLQSPRLHCSIFSMKNYFYSHIGNTLPLLIVHIPTRYLLGPEHLLHMTNGRCQGSFIFGSVFSCLFTGAISDSMKRLIIMILHFSMTSSRGIVSCISSPASGITRSSRTASIVTASARTACFVQICFSGLWSRRRKIRF
jgi:hypothetical protein